MSTITAGLSSYAASLVRGVMKAPESLLTVVAQNRESDHMLRATATALREAHGELMAHARENSGTDAIAYNTAAAAARAAEKLIDESIFAEAGRSVELTQAAHDLIAFVGMLIEESSAAPAAPLRIAQEV